MVYARLAVGVDGGPQAGPACRWAWTARLLRRAVRLGWFWVAVSEIEDEAYRGGVAVRRRSPRILIQVLDEASIVLENELGVQRVH